MEADSQVKLVARVPEVLHRKVRIAGAQDRLTVQEIVEEALTQWLAKREPK